MTKLSGWDEIGEYIGWGGDWARIYHKRALDNPERWEPLPVRYKGRTPESTVEELDAWWKRLPREAQ